MISLTRLMFDAPGPGDHLRYGPARRSGGARSDLPPRPVVVFNTTRRCNLCCAHCYSASGDRPAPDELTTDEAREMIADLGRFHVPVLLLSGGEPLMRPDLFELIDAARRAHIRVVLSTNGTMIDRAGAARLARAAIAYVGISLDGPREVHDRFRRCAGAFDAALAGLRHCRQAGLRVGLRLTLHRGNVEGLDALFDLVANEGIERVCFYHLVSTGRGGELNGQRLTPSETRDAINRVADAAGRLHQAGHRPEVLTVGNHADGPYLLMRLARDNPRRADEAANLLARAGGNASGERIACVRWNGDILPDQFWASAVTGNVRDRAFSDVWTSPAGSLLAALRERPAHLVGRCLRCRWLAVCNGNLRARAEAAGDRWGDDPACYLTDAEIAP